jgi:hypothetical protein
MLADGLGWEGRQSIQTGRQRKYAGRILSTVCCFSVGTAETSETTQTNKQQSAAGTAGSTKTEYTLCNRNAAADDDDPRRGEKRRLDYYLCGGVRIKSHGAAL